MKMLVQREQIDLTGGNGTLQPAQQTSGQNSVQQSYSTIMDNINVIKTIKLPEFRKEHAEKFLMMCENSFALYAITADMTKYRHLLSALDYDTLDYIDEIVKNRVNKTQ